MSKTIDPATAAFGVPLGYQSAPPPELIVVAKAGTDWGVLRAALAEGAGLKASLPMIAQPEIFIRPLFPPRIRRHAALMAPMAGTGATAFDFYHVGAPSNRMTEIAKRMRQHDAVVTVYEKPCAFPASLNPMTPLPAAPPPTPDFQSRQIYLQAAPVGIDALYAWRQPGGGGMGVNIIDVEYAWRFTHEDLRLNKGGVIAGTPSAEVDYRNHGTAVIGILGADRNSIGVTGIAPDAMIRAAACNGGVGTSEAIVQAAGPLSVGDILVIELHRPGPQYGFALRNDQLGFIPIEWWPDDFAAIQYAVGIGIIVVAAGGNGAQNLDDSLYDVNPVSTPYGSFPPSWSKPFRRGSVDSGAILVGAGAPPPQTHGRSWGAARSRLDFSNYGSCIDAQGWGREATTTGYGDLQGGPDEDVWYTDQFAGTSSATPIVAGAMGCVQGNRRARKSGSLTPAEARLLLRSTGSAQDPASALQRIGNLPDLRQLLAGTPPVASLSRVVPTGPKTRASRKIPKPKKSAARSRKKKKAPGK